MKIDEASEKAKRILEEEQVHPTLGYHYVSSVWPSNQRYQHLNLQQLGYTPASAAQIGLVDEHKQRPRHVYDDPKLYLFRSTNFDLLLKLFSQVADGDRITFVSRLLTPVRNAISGYRHNFVTSFPSFQSQTSALALVAEFCIRTGHLNELLTATEEPKMPTASLAIMLKEIEEMIALNFNLFSDSELTAIPDRLAQLKEIADRQTYSSRGTRGAMKENPHYKQGFSDVGNEMVQAIDGITEECRQARYWYLKGALQELPNLEIESDKVKVESFLGKLGFSPDMVKALDAAERDYKSTASNFELKNSLGHLRSFLEHLHRESAKSIAAASGQTVIDRWGDATGYLRQQGYFTKQHEAFITALYTLLSDESVHPLTTDREYARLLRGVVIEYGVMFLTMLDRRGVTI